MKLGFDLFKAIDDAGAKTYEVFPTASYKLLKSSGCADTVKMPLKDMMSGPKDMLDAIVISFTVLRFFNGFGPDIGGGDGLGAIVLPDKIDSHPVEDWPSEI